MTMLFTILFLTLIFAIVHLFIRTERIRSFEPGVYRQNPPAGSVTNNPVTGTAVRRPNARDRPGK